MSLRPEPGSVELTAAPRHGGQARQTENIMATTPIPGPPEPSTGQGPAPAPDAPTRPGPLGRLAGVAYRRRRRGILGWPAAFALAAGLAAAFARGFGAD